MAPLLFPNLTVLGIIALWQLRTNEVQGLSGPFSARNVAIE